MRMGAEPELGADGIATGRPDHGDQGRLFVFDQPSRRKVWRHPSRLSEHAFARGGSSTALSQSSTSSSRWRTSEERRLENGDLKELLLLLAWRPYPKFQASIDAGGHG